MKRIVLWIFMAVFFASCGGGGGGLTAVSSYADLGECSSLNEGAIRIVSEENQQYRCEDGEWNEYENKVSPFGESGNQSGGSGWSSGGTNEQNGGFGSSNGLPGGMCSFESSFIESDDLCLIKTDYKTYIKIYEKCHNDGEIIPDCKGSTYITYSDVTKSVTLTETACTAANEVGTQELQQSRQYCDTMEDLVSNPKLQKYDVAFSCNWNTSGSPMYESSSMSIYLYGADFISDSRNNPSLLTTVFYSIDGGPYQLNTARLEEADKLEEYCASREKCDIFGAVAKSLEASCVSVNMSDIGLEVSFPIDYSML